MLFGRVMIWRDIFGIIAPNIGVPLAHLLPDMPPKPAKRSRIPGVCVSAFLLLTGMAACADEKLPVLKVGSQVYSNVTVTSVTAADLYFRYAGGIYNAKLKNLSPELQKHFKFDLEKAEAAKLAQRQANAEFQADLASRKPVSRLAVEFDENENIVQPELYARSLLGQRPPQIIVNPWLTPPPDVTGKFVLVEFWTTWGEPCRRAIPHLNDLQSKFKDRLVVIGLSNETPEDIRKMASPRMEYSVGTDTQARTLNMVGVRAVPHAILIDPEGIVRFEGVPSHLTEEGLEHLMTRQPG